MINIHYIKYARIRVFTDPYSPVSGQNRRFCPYTSENGSVNGSENGSYSRIFYVVIIYVQSQNNVKKQMQGLY